MASVVLRRRRALSLSRGFSAMAQQPDAWCSSTDGARHAKYPKLFEPLTLRSGLVLRNRTLMGSMHTGLEEKKGPSGALDDMAQFYAERALGGVGLIVTGGLAPNREGWVAPMAAKLSTQSEIHHHLVVTKAVHDAGGLIAMQILHAGRYAYHPFSVSAMAKKAPIGMSTPRALSAKDIEGTIDDFARCAELAKAAGYDGVEVMGSEGYLLNQFLAPRTNQRTDDYGGSAENRARLALTIARRVRQAAGETGFALIFRLSLLELVEDGMSFEESCALATELSNAGVDVINTGIGWHEARVPTIGTCVPRAAFVFPTKKLGAFLGPDRKVALCATNRINNAQTAEDVLRDTGCDLVSMARPFLADARIVAKAFQGQEDETNTCIACNQACLDHTFELKPVSCLVNPRAGHELSLNLVPTSAPLKVAVVGAGPAGLSCATALAERGHSVTLFEASGRVGGQFNLAAKIPGKSEFWETIRYFSSQITKHHVDLRLNTKIGSKDVEDFDRIVVATGVVPRHVKLEGAGTIPGAPRVHNYVDVIEGRVTCGDRVAIIGAGGIGFDVAEFLSHKPHAEGGELAAFYDEWGVDTDLKQRGGLKPTNAGAPLRKIHLLQRKATPVGAGLGKTTGWIHRVTLRNRGVEFVKGVEYVGVDAGGLLVKVGGKAARLEVDDVVLCAGQQSVDGLFKDLKDAAAPAFIIGGAQEAGELDAKRAIDQGYRLAAQIEDAPAGSVFAMPVGWKAGAIKYVRGLLGR
ncbi:hypothetical protein M885DRAFT_520550 [Pelagophyceae sp. CCMP2097]|nr:hypothetical protein M885DRAFT_520550 [Pelagophyceae sp. CCMP2097]